MSGEEHEPATDLASVESAAIAAARTARVREPKEGESVQLPDIVIPEMMEIKEVDAVASTLAYNPSIARGGTVDAGDFAVTRPYSFAMSGTTVVHTGGAYTVSATVDNAITYQVRSSTGPSSQANIASEADTDITASNWPTVVSDLTPNMSDLNGRPPRTKFWARDLSITHELYHCTDGRNHARSGVTLAQNWLNGQTASSAAAVHTLLAAVPARVAATRRAAMTWPGREERAYGDGASLYRARANAIKAKGDRGSYP